MSGITSQSILMFSNRLTVLAYHYAVQILLNQRKEASGGDPSKLDVALRTLGMINRKTTIYLRLLEDVCNPEAWSFILSLAVDKDARTLDVDGEIERRLAETKAISLKKHDRMDIYRTETALEWKNHAIILEASHFVWSKNGLKLANTTLEKGPRRVCSEDRRDSPESLGEDRKLFETSRHEGSA